MRMNRLGPASRAGAALLILAIGTGHSVGPAAEPARGGRDTLETALSNSARAIGSFLRKEGADSVAVKTFTSRGTPPATGGVAIRQELIEKLQDASVTRQRVQIKPTAPFTIHGNFAAARPSKDDSFAVHITIVVEDAQSQTKLNLPAKVYSDEDILRLIGPNVALPVVKDQPTNVPVAGPSTDEDADADFTPPTTPKGEREARFDALVKAIDPENGPPVRFEAGSFVAADAPPLKSEIRVGDTPYSIEILVKNDQTAGKYVPRAPKLVEGQPFVEIKPGEVYAVRLINDSTRYDAGVKLSIDGLSTFQFSENADYKQLDKWLIRRQSHGVIRGWHLRNQDGKMVLAEFKVNSYGEIPAVQMGSPQEYGTITATFCAAWRKGEEPPPSDIYYERVRGTGQGETRVEELDEVQRFFGKPRASISVRYERSPIAGLSIETRTFQ